MKALMAAVTGMAVFCIGCSTVETVPGSRDETVPSGTQSEWGVPTQGDEQVPSQASGGSTILDWTLAAGETILQFRIGRGQVRMAPATSRRDVCPVAMRMSLPRLWGSPTQSTDYRSPLCLEFSVNGNTVAD